MLIVVTGSSGRLGSFVVGELLANGHDVLPVDVKPAVDASRPPTRIVDLMQDSELSALFKGADAVCHLANIPYFDGKPFTHAHGFKVNTTTTYNVLEAANAAGVRRVVYASSIQAYGCVASRLSSPPEPMPPQYLPVDENHPLQPRDAYPLSKAVGEQIVESFARLDGGMSAISLRFTTVKLPRPVGWIAAPRPMVDRKVWRDYSVGRALFTFVQAADAARAMRLACEVDCRGHAAINVASPRSLQPWSREMIMKDYGLIPEFRRPLQSDDALLDTARARAMLGFVAELPPFEQDKAVV